MVQPAVIQKRTFDVNFQASFKDRNCPSQANTNKGADSDGSTPLLPSRNETKNTTKINNGRSSLEPS